MSYRQDLREAELAVIRAAEVVWAAAVQHNDRDRRDRRFFAGPWTVTHDFFQPFHEAISDLRILRSQLDSAPAPYSEDDTSRTAADMIAPLAGSLRRSILVELYRRRKWPVPGATDDQLERALKRAHTSVSAARNFLVDTGWVIDSGHRVETCSGRPAKVWSLASGATDRLLNTIALEEP